MRIIYSLVCTFLLIMSLATDARAQPAVRTRDVITGLDTPWEILWGPDGWLWMTERGGRISRVNPDNGEQQILLTLTDVHEQGESGLLGMALHPDFPDSAYVYVVYNYMSGSVIAEKLVRYTYTPGQVLSDPRILLQSIPGFPTHNGSRLLVTPDRKLLMTTGDAQNQPGAQSHALISGKILRLNLDGSAPADNPWPGAPYPANYIYTTGHRNPQGLTIGPGGRIFSSEHGPNNDDEINIISARGNYGWPTVMGICDEGSETKFCADSSVVEPIKTWTPTLAVAGIAYYAGTAIPEFGNSLLMTTLKEADLRVLKLNADGSRIVSETVLYDNVYGRLRDIALAPDGRVFIATSNRDGRAANGFPKSADDRIVEIRTTAAGATIFAPTVTPVTLQGGEQMQVAFSASGPFTSGNVFTIQLSDSAGGFDAPTILGTLEGTNGGAITTLLPCDVVPGTGYRARVISTAPAATSPVSGIPVTVLPTAQAVIAGFEEKLYCPGSSVQLSVSGGTNPRWSPAAGLSCSDCPNPTVTISEPRTYIATLRNTFGCDVRDTVTFELFPQPVPQVTVDGTTLTASEGFASYEWILADSGTVVSTERTFTATRNGDYVVSVIDSNGCRGFSRAVEVRNAGIVDESRNADLRIAPSPMRERLEIELALGRAGRLRVELVDMRGIVIDAGVIEARSGVARGSIDVSGLSSGAYLVRITSGAEQWVRSVVKE
jgi:aldose sugar dehydrogenase